jgi:hypothetical protein
VWKNILFWLWKVQEGTSSLHREMERPFKQVAWGEEKFVVTSSLCKKEHISSSFLKTFHDSTLSGICGL